MVDRDEPVDAENHTLSAMCLLTAIEPKRLGGILDCIVKGGESSVVVCYWEELGLEDWLV